MTDTTTTPPNGGALGAFELFLDKLDWLMGKIVIASMTVMVVVVVAQVFLRYVLNISLDWAEELSRLSFVWSVFFAIPLGIKRGAHVGVSLITDRLPMLMQSTLFRIMSALAAIMMAVVAYEATVLTRDQWDEPMSTLDISVGLFMVPLCIGAVHALLHLLFGVFNGPPPKPDLSAE
jgi:TRAP-type C4-dicarboxylate transport system permease small subunit